MRPGLLDTPRRVVKALTEMTAGYHEKPEEILSTVFDSNADQMVVVKDIGYSSMCEHHLLPFTGTVSVGYLPASGRVVGLSKIPRLVHCYARRFQIQEGMTMEIAAALMKHLEPLGVGVVVTGVHTCCHLRGARSHNEMVTSALLGAFRDEQRVRDEFFGLTRSR